MAHREIAGNYASSLKLLRQNGQMNFRCNRKTEVYLPLPNKVISIEAIVLQLSLVKTRVLTPKVLFSLTPITSHSSHWVWLIYDSFPILTQ